MYEVVVSCTMKGDESDVPSEKIKELFLEHKSISETEFLLGLEKIKEQYHNLALQNNKLRNKVAEWNKDNEIERLENLIEKMRRQAIYIRTDEELIDEKQFLNEHKSKCSGDMLYSFRGNGIGTWYKLTCEKCGESKRLLMLVTGKRKGESHCTQ